MNGEYTEELNTMQILLTRPGMQKDKAEKKKQLNSGSQIKLHVTQRMISLSALRTTGTQPSIIVSCYEGYSQTAMMIMSRTYVTNKTPRHIICC